MKCLCMHEVSGSVRGGEITWDQKKRKERKKERKKGKAWWGLRGRKVTWSRGGVEVSKLDLRRKTQDSRLEGLKGEENGGKCL